MGPTSNRHLVKRFQNLARRRSSFASSPTSTEQPRNTEENNIEDYLMHVYRSTVHTTISVFARDAFPQSARELPFILRCVVLAVAAYFEPEDSLAKIGLLPEETVLFYLRQFIDVMGHEIERSCVVNIKAFILRSYLAMLQGQSQQASIFLGMSFGSLKPSFESLVLTTRHRSGMYNVKRARFTSKQLSRCDR